MIVCDTVQTKFSRVLQSFTFHLTTQKKHHLLKKKSYVRRMFSLPDDEMQKLLRQPDQPVIFALFEGQFN